MLHFNMEYYFTPDNLINKNSDLLEISGEEFRHIKKSLRKTKGDILEVTNGNYELYKCVIDEIKSDRLICKILQKMNCDTEPDVKVNLHLCLLRNMQRIEFAIEKCVELGVFSITPVISQRTLSQNEPGKSKSERIKMIIKSAMCQSQRCYMPELKNTIKLKEIPEPKSDLMTNIVMYEFEDCTKKFPENKLKEVNLLIGPEGGFTEEEISYLKNKRWLSASLGVRKFRAETAAIISTYKLINQI